MCRSDSREMSCPSKAMLPRVDVDEPQERAPERRFPRTRFADDADGFASADPEVDAMQDFHAAHAFAAQRGACRRRRPRRRSRRKDPHPCGVRLGGAVIARSAATWRSRSRQEPCVLLDCFVASLLAMTVPCDGLAARSRDFEPQFSDQSLRHGLKPRVGPIVSRPRRDQGARVIVVRRRENVRRRPGFDRRRRRTAASPGRRSGRRRRDRG